MNQRQQAFTMSGRIGCCKRKQPNKPNLGTANKIYMHFTNLSQSLYVKTYMKLET